MVQQHLVVVRDVLPPELQWPDGQLEEGKFRGDASELTRF